MKRLAIALCIIVLLVIFSPGFSILAQSIHTPHENPATAKSSPDPVALMLSYSKTFDLIAIRQYQDAQSMLKELEQANIPGEIRYIVDHYTAPSQQLLTTLNKMEYLLDETSTLFSHNQISYAKAKLADAEAADKLAFNLITTALTFAHETIPTALTVYNHQRVVLTTTVIDPREILKQTLSLIKDITSVEFTHRFLQLPDISKLRRDISQLKQATSEPAQRLLSMLNFEYQAIEKAAKNQPATLALSSVTEHAPARAIIVLISQMNHDAEALQVTTEKLSKREFTIIPIETK